MRRIATLLAAATVMAVGLSTAPASAHDGWYSNGWQDNAWREHAWREREWREHAWRRHLWWEHHRGYPGYYQGSYASPTYYGAPATAYGYQ
jgi:hypothetical protein